MNKLNLKSILENAPSGTELFSPYCGKCIFNDVSDKIWVKNSSMHYVGFNYDGSLSDEDNAECLLFPHNEHRTWNNWQEILFKPGDIVFFDNSEEATRVSSIVIKEDGTLAGSDGFQFQTNNIQYYRYANKEEREQFIKELSEHNLKWSDTNKKLIKEEPFKFEVGQPVFIVGENQTYSVEEQYRDWDGNMYVLRLWGSKEDEKLLRNIHESNLKSWTLNHGYIVSCSFDDGDFSEIEKFIGIFNGIEDDFITMSCYLNVNKNIFEPDGSKMFCRESDSDTFKPATPEEVNLFSEKMISDGYYWNHNTEKVCELPFHIGDTIFKKDNPSQVLSIDKITNDAFYDSIRRSHVIIKDSNEYDKIKFELYNRIRQKDNPKTVMTITHIMEGFYWCGQEKIPLNEQDYWELANNGADLEKAHNIEEIFIDNKVEHLVSKFREENFNNKKNEIVDFIVDIYKKGVEDALALQDGSVMTRSLTPEEIAKFNEMLPEQEPFHNLIVEENDKIILGDEK